LDAFIQSDLQKSRAIEAIKATGSSGWNVCAQTGIHAFILARSKNPSTSVWYLQKFLCSNQSNCTFAILLSEVCHYGLCLGHPQRTTAVL